MTPDELAAITQRPELATSDPTADLRGDLGYDSLVLLEIIISLEDHTSIDAPPELIEATATIQDLLDWW